MILALLLSISTLAADKHFDFLQPYDQKITDALIWDDIEKAQRISDLTQAVTMVSPLFFALKEKDDRTAKAATVLGVTAVNYGLTGLVKYLTKRTRPNLENNKSFWSGHASSAFAGAALTCQFTKGTACTAMLAAALATGYLRIAGNKHFMSDCVVGAVVGYANGRILPGLIMEF